MALQYKRKNVYLGWEWRVIIKEYCRDSLPPPLPFPRPINASETKVEEIRQKRAEVPVPPDVVTKLTGRGATSIAKLKDKTGALIEVVKGKAGAGAEVHISGEADAVAAAKREVGRSGDTHEWSFVRARRLKKRREIPHLDYYRWSIH